MGALALIGRLFAILFGYLVAVIAASLFLHLLAFSALDAFFAELPPEAAAGSLLVSVPFVALFISYFAFLPAMAVILLGELIGRSGWLFHALAGGGVALAVSGALAQDPARDVSDPGLLMAAVAAGMVGGIAYWIVAGRRAGYWRRAVGDQGDARP